MGESQRVQRNTAAQRRSARPAEVRALPTAPASVYRPSASAAEIAPQPSGAPSFGHDFGQIAVAAAPERGPGAYAGGGEQAVAAIQREPAPPGGDLTLQTPSLFPVGGARPGLRPEAAPQLQLSPEFQAMALQHIQRQLDPAFLASVLSRARLGTPPPIALGLPPAGPTYGPPAPAGAGQGLPAVPTPPAPQPYDGDPGLREGGGVSGDLVDALKATPEVQQMLGGLAARAGEQWSRLGPTGKVGVVSGGVAIVGGVVGGILADPGRRQWAIEQLNGHVLPVPGVDWLHIEVNADPAKLFVGAHVDVGALLPPSWGFGPSPWSPQSLSASPANDASMPGQRVAAHPGAALVPAQDGEIGQAIRAAAGGGSPLGADTHATLATGLSVDLSDVRIHHDGEADRLARAVDAVAFTSGQDIFFRAGTYDPHSRDGQRLLAHETIHTVQQAAGPVAGTPQPGGVAISDPGDRFEREAEQGAARLLDAGATSSHVGRAASVPVVSDGIDQLYKPSDREEGGAQQAQPRQPTQSRSHEGNTSPGLTAARFGHDFSQMRVHAETRFVAPTASAATIGQDRTLAQDRDQPDSDGEQVSVAHESVSVARQGRGDTQPTSPRPLASTPYVQRDPTPPSPYPEQRERIDVALKSKDPGDVKAIGRGWYFLASEDEKFDLIGILLNQGWVGPRDEYALEDIWESFGHDLEKIASGKGLILWNQSVERGAELYKLRELDYLRERFKADVAKKANEYLTTNQTTASTELTKIGGDQADSAPNADQTKYMQDVKKSAERIKRAQEGIDRLSRMLVVYNYADAPGINPNDPNYGKHYASTFNPYATVPPMDSGTLPLSAEDEAGYATWEATKKKYVDCQEVVKNETHQYPTVFALLRDEQIANVAGADQNQARQTALKSLQETIANIQKTRPLVIDPTSDFPLELKPIHDQLFQSDPRWSATFAKQVAQQTITEHDNVEFWKTVGLGTLGAALFIVGELATGGAATALLIAGAGTSAKQAYNSWDKYLEYQAAANTHMSPDTALLSQGAATEVLVVAVLDTVFAFLDAYSVGVRGIKGGLAGADASKRLAEAEAHTAELAAKGTEQLSPALANKGTRLIHTSREQALHDLVEEAAKSNIIIHSDEEAQALLDWSARQAGEAPENFHAVTIGGEDIFVRPQYAENVRVLREEMIHIFQQRAGTATNEIVEKEIEARLLMIRFRQQWSITNDEVREMIREIRQMRRTGRY